MIEVQTEKWHSDLNALLDACDGFSGSFCMPGTNSSFRNPVPGEERINHRTDLSVQVRGVTHAAAPDARLAGSKFKDKEKKNARK
jgi:hypothetical protein